MITARDHSTGLLFDRWSHIGPKRRKLLDTSWPGVFRNFLLHKLPVERIAARFTEYTGRPSKELYAMLGALILQQTQDLSDEEVQRAVAFDLGWHYALDITDDTDASTYISERTFRNYRRMILAEGLVPLISRRTCAAHHATNQKTPPYRRLPKKNLSDLPSSKRLSGKAREKGRLSSL